MGLVRWITGFFIAILVAIFAVLNRHNVELFWSPVHSSYEMPFYLAGLSMMGFGFVLGCLMIWLNSASLRRIKRKQRKQIKNLEKELAAVNENGESKKEPPADFFPMLSYRTRRQK